MSTVKTFVIVVIVVLIQQHLAAQQNVLLLEDYEDNQLDPRITIETIGSFNSSPGIKDITEFGSTKAFGYGISTCSVNCFNDYVTKQIITFPELTYIDSISFKEMELFGNWGSKGQIYLDGIALTGNQQDFGRSPSNDGNPDTTFREHTIAIDTSLVTIELRVWDITNLSEIYIDDLVIYSSSITSISEDNSMFNNNFILYPNYPNPFNPTTTIKYQIPELSFVTLKVYDVLGSEILTLVNEEKPAGSYEINFKATNLSSGIYFYKLQAGSFVETKKMILMK